MIRGGILILKGGIKLKIVDPQSQYYVTYHQELIAELKELLKRCVLDKC